MDDDAHAEKFIRFSAMTERLFDSILSLGPPPEIDPLLLKCNWPEKLPYLRFGQDGRLPIKMCANGDVGYPVKEDVELPNDVKEYVVPGISTGSRVLLPNAPVLREYLQVFWEKPWFEAKRAIDDLHDQITDPDNSEPLPRSFIRQNPELLAWLNGENPDYLTSLTDYKVLWPAFIERRRKIKERALGNSNPNGSRESEANEDPPGPTFPDTSQGRLLKQRFEFAEALRADGKTWQKIYDKYVESKPQIDDLAASSDAFRYIVTKHRPDLK